MKYPWCPLSKLSNVSLGFKSLQNDFYYISDETSRSFGIESEYLRPIFLLKNMDANHFKQSITASCKVFYCNSSERDLAGTRALRYIRSMGDRSAATRRQTGETLTIREALKRQGGTYWYGPKARVNQANIWLRKAINGVYSPFIFDTPVLVDQRCNRVIPIESISWEELAAVLSSTFFSLAMEVHGATGMGAGALEVATSTLKQVPVLDLKKLSLEDKNRLVKFARELWEEEEPIDWTNEPHVSANQRALDELISSFAGVEVDLDDIYRDLQRMVDVRTGLQHQRRETGRSRAAADVGAVATGITTSIRRIIEGRRFPEGFFSTDSEDETFNFEHQNSLTIHVHPMLGDFELSISDESGTLVLDQLMRKSKAEVVIRALMMGREVFHVPLDESENTKLLNDFTKWIREIVSRIESEISESSLGTGFEDVLRKQVYANLKLHPNVAEPVLDQTINISK